MSHEHRYAGFSSGGTVEQRCQGCFALKPEGEAAPEPQEALAVEAESDEDSGQVDGESATLRPNKRSSSRRTDG